jgi:hypothetical protein
MGNQKWQPEKVAFIIFLVDNSVDKNNACKIVGI